MGLALALGGFAQQAEEPAFSARDIFESAKGLFARPGQTPGARPADEKPAQTTAVASAPFARPPSQKKPTETTTTASGPVARPPAARPVRTTPSANAPTTQPPPAKPSRQAPPAKVDVDNRGATNRYGAEVVKLSAGGEVEVTQPVLGLRYSIEKAARGNWQEVSPTAEFKNGDTIRLVVETSEPAYLYIVNKGTSGSWNPLFPSKQNMDTDHRVEAGEVRTFPSQQGFTFYGDAGEEKLFVVASRRPQDDLEELIYRLGDSGSKSGQEAAPQSPNTTTLVASNFGSAFDARADEQLAKMRSRDLFVETIDEPIATGNDGHRVAKAVYVVNVSGDDDSQVIAEVPLIHR